MDKSAIIGVEIDDDGWEYGSSFSSFTVFSKKRVLQAMDCVRRRRYIRVRVPIPNKVSAQSEIILEDLDEFDASDRSFKPSFAPYTVFWDMQTLTNGARRVDIRSCLQIRNNLSYPIRIYLTSAVWSDNVEMGPIDSNELFSVPLIYSSAYTIRFKPDNLPYEWSAHLVCAIRPIDYPPTFSDIICRGDDMVGTSFRAMQQQENKSLLITLLPFVVISNKLPCSLIFQCSTTEGFSNASLPTYEHGIIASGSKVKLSHVNFLYQPKLMVKVGRYDWSEPHLIGAREDISTIIFECKLNKDFQEGGVIEGRDLILACKSKLVDQQYLEVTIFSKVVVVDRTRLDVSVFCNSKRLNKGILRHTWVSEPGQILEPSSNSPKLSISSTKIIAETASNTFRKSRSDMDLLKGNKISDNLVGNFIVNSKRKYEFSSATIGSHIYTDRKIRWSHFPPLFNNQIHLRTPFEDLTLRSSKIAQFSIYPESVVFVFTDVKSPPSWIETDSFRSINELAMGSRLKGGFIEEFHFTIYGKYFAAGSIFSLKGNWNKQMSTMYSLFVIPYSKLWDMQASNPRHIPYFGSFKPKVKKGEGGEVLSTQSSFNRRVIEEIRFDESFDDGFRSQMWSEGGCNLTLMHSEDNLLFVGLCRGSIWSHDAISIDTKKNSATKGSFEIDDKDRQITYCLTYSLQQLPGFYNDSQVFSFQYFLVDNN